MYQCVCDFYCAATQLKAPRTVLGIVRYTNLIGLDWIGYIWGTWWPSGSTRLLRLTYRPVTNVCAVCGFNPGSRH
jgi:hypothetical protein